MVLTAMVMTSSIFCDITPCSPLKVTRRFRGSPRDFTLVSCSAYSTLKMEANCSSETSVVFQRTALRYIPFACYFLPATLSVNHIPKGRAIAQAVSRWLPTAAARVRAGVWSSEICGRQSGRFSPSTSVSPANLHSTNFSIIIINRGWYNRPFSGRRAEWTQLGLHPPLCELKKNIYPP
jgi:hypothetical protein